MASPNQDRREDFRVLLAARPEKARPLHEFAAPADPASRTHASAGACQPRVTLHRDGERVIGIHIQCSCGQVLDLSCSYQPEVSAKTIS